MSGAINIARSLIYHPIVGVQHPKRMAVWLWMLTAARYKPGRVEIGGRMVELQRGQLSHSLRFIADVTPMSVQELRTFFKALARDNMIAVETNTGQNVITICNYDSYQLDPGHSNTRSTQHQHNTNTAPTQIRIPEEIPDVIPDGGGVAREDDPEQIHEKCCQIIGVSRETHPGFAASHWVRTWLGRGSTAADIVDGIREGLASLNGDKPGNMKYFDKPVARVTATRTAAPPDVKPRASPKQSPHQDLYFAGLKVAQEFMETEE